MSDDKKRKRGNSQQTKSTTGNTARKSTTGRFGDDSIKAVCKYIRQGYKDSDACHLAGVHPTTFRTWMAKGEHAEKGKYRQAYVKVEKARIKREGELVGQIEYRGGTDWKSSAWLLERTSKRFSRQGEPERGKINIEDLTDAEIGALLLELAKRNRLNHAAIP